MKTARKKKMNEVVSHETERKRLERLSWALGASRRRSRFVHLAVGKGLVKVKLFPGKQEQ